MGKQLLTEDKVAVTFGCWTSVSRKSCLPVFEEHNGLLFYPVQYEGEEQSLNVFYTAASPNQQLVPAAEYMKEEMGMEKFYLLGTDYVFPRTANKVLKAYLKSKGVPDENIAEEYTPFHHQDYQTIVSKVKEFAADGNACILSTINGDSNVPFYKEFANQGFADDFKSYCEKTGLPGGKSRVTDDPIEAAYFGVYVWKAAVEKAGSFEVDKVRNAVYGLEFDSPSGKKKMHESNQHTLKPVYIGEILVDGQFEIVAEFNDGDLVVPDSYSSYLWPDGNYPKPTPEAKYKELQATCCKQ